MEMYAKSASIRFWEMDWRMASSVSAGHPIRGGNLSEMNDEKKEPGT